LDRVSAGTFHDLHLAWIAAIRNALNERVLPPDYYAMAEQTEPKVQFRASANMDEYVLKRRTPVIRHSSDDRIVALLEIVSPGNKSGRHQPLTLAAYSAGEPKQAFVQPVAVGEACPLMPLFLEAEQYVNVPLEETYMEAYRGVPRR
jgi:hypothetical protein